MPAGHASACLKLAAMRSTGATIMAAKAGPAGAFTTPAQVGKRLTTMTLPAAGSAQVAVAAMAAIKQVCSQASHSAGPVVSAGLPCGTECEWSCSTIKDASNLPRASAWLQHDVRGDDGWNDTTCHGDVNPPDADALLASAPNAWLPHSDGFRATGGELLLSQGPADAVVLPAVGHCGSQEPGAPDPMAPVARSVEPGIAPDVITPDGFTATDPLQISRPLCPSPQQTLWSGKGGTGGPTNFSCGLPAVATTAAEP